MINAIKAIHLNTRINENNFKNVCFNTNMEQCWHEMKHKHSYTLGNKTSAQFQKDTLVLLLLRQRGFWNSGGVKTIHSTEDKLRNNYDAYLWQFEDVWLSGFFGKSEVLTKIHEQEMVIRWKQKSHQDQDFISDTKLVPLLLSCSHFLLSFWNTLESDEHSYDRKTWKKNSEILLASFNGHERYNWHLT